MQFIQANMASTILASRLKNTSLTSKLMQKVSVSSANSEAPQIKLKFVENQKNLNQQKKTASSKQGSQISDVDPDFILVSWIL